MPCVIGALRRFLPDNIMATNRGCILLSHALKKIENIVTSFAVASTRLQCGRKRRSLHQTSRCPFLQNHTLATVSMDRLHLTDTPSSPSHTTPRSSPLSPLPSFQPRPPSAHPPDCRPSGPMESHTYTYKHVSTDLIQEDNLIAQLTRHDSPSSQSPLPTQQTTPYTHPISRGATSN